MGYFAALISDMYAPARAPKTKAPAVPQGDDAKTRERAAVFAHLETMSKSEVIAAAKKRIDEETKALSPIRRGIKASVAHFLEARCQGHPAFARLTLDPQKSMAACFRYIDRKVREVAQREMEDYGLKPENGIYTLDIPNDLCYSWGVAYFEDPYVPEDYPDGQAPNPGKAPDRRTPKKPPINVEKLVSCRG